MIALQGRFEIRPSSPRHSFLSTMRAILMPGNIASLLCPKRVKDADKEGSRANTCCCIFAEPPWRRWTEMYYPMLRETCDLNTTMQCLRNLQRSPA